MGETERTESAERFLQKTKTTHQCLITWATSCTPNAQAQFSCQPNNNNNFLQVQTDIEMRESEVSDWVTVCNNTVDAIDSYSGMVATTERNRQRNTVRNLKEGEDNVDWSPCQVSFSDSQGQSSQAKRLFLHSNGFEMQYSWVMCALSSWISALVSFDHLHFEWSEHTQSSSFINKVNSVLK